MTATVRCTNYEDVLSFSGVHNQQYINDNSVYFPLSLVQLIAYSFSLGTYNTFRDFLTGFLYYSSLPYFLLRISDGKYVSSDAYKYSEQSFKTAFSFYIGMLAAKVVADQKYHIKHLLHLNDCSLEYVSKTGKHPDFFGSDTKGINYLFEAKGTASQRCDSDDIKNAKEQLNAISHVKRVGNPKPRKISSKRIIASSFPKETWTIDDIDPSESGDVTLSLDFDKAMFLYYRTIMELLLHAPSRSERTFSGTPFVCARVTDELCVGLHKGCYDFFQKGYEQYFTSQTSSSQVDVEPERFCPNVYDETTSILSSFTPPEATETLSILPDGILCASTL